MIKKRKKHVRENRRGNKIKKSRDTGTIGHTSRSHSKTTKQNKKKGKKNKKEQKRKKKDKRKIQHEKLISNTDRTKKVCLHPDASE